MQLDGQFHHGTVQMNAHRRLGAAQEFRDLGSLPLLQARQDERLRLPSRQPSESRDQLLLQFVGLHGGIRGRGGGKVQVRRFKSMVLYA